MGKAFEKIDVNEERELEHLIKNDPSQVEKGLRYLSHQYPAGRKALDVLCVDSEGALVVIELKTKEDESTLIQALDYFDYVKRNVDRLANEFSDKNINSLAEPRIILCAPDFSERLKKAAKHFSPEIKLLSYIYLKHKKSGEKELICNEVMIEAEKEYKAPIPIEKTIEYIYSPKLRDVCHEVVAKIQGIGDGIELKSRKKAIYAHYKNRRIASLYLLKEGFYIGYEKGSDGKWRYCRIESKKDWNNVKDKVVDRVGRCFCKLGGEVY